MNSFKALSVAAVILLGASIAHADGADARVGVSGGSGSSGDCTSFQLTTDSTGAIVTSPDTECKVTGVNATSITVASPVGDTGTQPGLQVYSPLTTDVTANVPSWAAPFLAQFNWTETCPSSPTMIGGTSAFECTLTAPTMPTDPLSTLILSELTKMGVINDGNCDSDDFVFYIPVGCDVKFTTGAIGDLPGDTPDQLFSQNAQLDAVSNGGTGFIPFPEPDAFSLLLIGVAGLPFLRRRFAR
ncbi:MAG: hypothetical protein WCC03_16665 [Candidatus Acidiferrales bacterium]